MKAKHYFFTTLGFAVAFLPSCNTSDDDDALANLGIEIHYYDGDTQMFLTELATTIKSNRSITFNIQEFDRDDFTKVEVTRTTGGQTITCENTNDDGEIYPLYVDWPAADTEYTLTVYAGSESKSFGPYDITVEAPGSMIHGNVAMGDQGYDNSNGYGPFFQSRRVGWGGGWNYANWRSQFANGHPRVLDFAILSTAGQLRTVSPDDILANGTWPLLENDCGFMTTKFALYTGGIDPQNDDPSEAELLALPAPTLSTVNVDEGTRFYYETADGKRGLIKIRDITTTATGIRFKTHYAVIQ